MVVEESEVPLAESPEPAWPRYIVHMAYDGTNYHGWQRQLNGHSIQAEMEEALRKLLRQEKVVTTGCGRTDSGVHARNFYFHFNAQKEIVDIPEVLRKLNMMLPWDLAIFGLYRMPDKVHTRFDAFERSYEYHIHQKRDPFRHRFSWYYPWSLHMDTMNAAASELLNYTDFAAFAKTKGGQKTSICDLRRAEWVKEGDRMVFHITADRFLRNMVRAIVGTLIAVGKGKLTIEEMKRIVEHGKREQAGDSVPASGLHLTEIKYPYSIP
jgi:tRNA pseudouridine38-40 synthase